MILRKVMEFRAKYRDVEKEWVALEEDLMHLLNIDEGDIAAWAQECFEDRGETYQFKDKLEWYFKQLKTFDLQRVLDKIQSTLDPKGIMGEMLKDKRDGSFYITIDTDLSVKTVKEIIDKYYFSRFSGSFDDIEFLSSGLTRMSLIITPVGSY